MAQRRRNQDADVQRAIYDRLLKGYGPKQVWDELRRDPALGPRVPSVRTIQYMAKEARPAPGEPWSVTDQSTADEELELVLDVVRELASSEGDPGWLTRDEARWIIRLRTADSHLPPLTSLALARLYIARAAESRTTYDLDAVLALAPWRGELYRDLYETAVRKRRVPDLVPLGPSVAVVTRA